MREHGQQQLLNIPKLMKMLNDRLAQSQKIFNKAILVLK